MPVSNETLSAYGWSNDRQAEFDSLASDASLPGRVVRVDRGSFLVATDVGTDRCHAGGARAGHDLPVTGDWVAVRPEPGLGFVLERVLPRRSVIKRLDPTEASEQELVANVDTMFILHGLDRPHRVGRVERLCLITWDGGATPVVVMTKTDLEDDGSATIGLLDAIDEIGKVVRGVDIIPVSSVTGAGLNLLNPYLQPGDTVGLLGESGSGKSTLVNRLVDDNVQATGETRRGDSKGRHTTTSRELIALPSGAVLIDTPGLRSIAMLGNRTGLEQSYADVESLFDRCRFRDCGHGAEPECAVVAAVDSGELSRARWAGYQKLLREIAFEERRAGDRVRRAEFKEWNKKLAKFRRRQQD
jgi:ribosome biogenesis GTPase